MASRMVAYEDEIFFGPAFSVSKWPLNMGSRSPSGELPNQEVWALTDPEEKIVRSIPCSCQDRIAGIASG